MSVFDHSSFVLRERRERERENAGENNGEKDIKRICTQNDTNKFLLYANELDILLLLFAVCCCYEVFSLYLFISCTMWCWCCGRK